MWNIYIAFGVENTAKIDSILDWIVATSVRLYVVQVSRVGKTWK